MSEKFSSWLCCQIGAREHYAIPRALQKAGLLNHLITDAWILPNSPLNLLPKPLLANLRERFHRDLEFVSVYSFNNSLISLELNQRIQKKSGWLHIISRNHWFQQKTISLLRKIYPQINSPATLFAYSYAALDLFCYAKKQGWRTILGQIDPGIVEEQLVLKEHARYPNYQSSYQAAPSEYWTNWLKECSLADRIVVNSFWSSQALQKVGISEHKIDIIPLAYQAPETTANFVRFYPANFSKERPLKVLFLGQIILRKGIAAVLEAVELLRDKPIELWLVGSQGIPQPQQFHSKIKWIGAVSRSATSKYYQQADVFLFPTLSDGFGLTQLEAQAWKLPIIASKFCGDVVKDHFNGLLLQEVTGEAIANALLFCLNNPQQLDMFSRQSSKLDDFNLSQLNRRLQALS
ncbi:MAG: glycosyltransferase family 4 protein [Fischerella sp. CENA71]|nr:glycosyltransferase family 4 protein [Fischerella sp. CENA71]